MRLSSLPLSRSWLPVTSTEGIKRKASNIDSVSYTHLDVYKRQVDYYRMHLNPAEMTISTDYVSRAIGRDLTADQLQLILEMCIRDSCNPLDEVGIAVTS